MHPNLSNERPIISFPNGVQLSYADGNKDNWCVYLYSEEQSPRALRDIEYFDDLKNLAENYGADYVYADFVSVYDSTTETLDQRVLNEIKTISKTRYPKEATSVAILFSILYMAMVAEYYYVNWCGRPSRLNKRTKRLGIHQILFDGYSVDQAANFSRGKNYRELNRLCNQYGF